MLNDGTSPDKLMNRFKRYPAIALYRKVYGADGHISRPDLPVTEACTTTIKWWRHREVKSFVSLKNAGQRVNSHHVAGAVNPDFLPVRGMFDSPVYGLAHISHYYTKSREDFADRLRVGTPCYSNRDCDGS
jgi:hypothetical protein